MSNLRAFIAIEIPSEIQTAIFQETTGLRQALERPLVRWVASQNLHLTLKFLGDVTPSNLELLQQTLLTEAEHYPCFDLQVSGLGVFPSPKRPRVLWVGIQAPTVLEVLQRAIETATERLGYPSERRPFSPHLTIGRVNQHTSHSDLQRIAAAVAQTTVGRLGTASIQAVRLFRSDLQPGGPIYTQLFSAPLADQNL